MSLDDTARPLVHLLAGPVRRAVDHSAYGDWRLIADADAVSLSYGFPDPALFPEARLVKSVTAVLDEEGDDALQYGGGSYTDRLEEFLLERERDRGIDFDTQDLLVTNGATHAIDTACRAFLEPGDTVVVEEPTFMGALGVFRNFGVDVVGVPVDEEGLDVDALEGMLETMHGKGESPTMLYTIPDFHNPTGTTLSRERRERVLELAGAYEFAVLEDGAYSDLYFDGEPPPALAALDPGRVVRVGTFAKTIVPGVRLGWLTAPSQIREAARTVSPGGTNTFARSVVGHYCDVGHFEELVPELREAYAKKRTRFLAELEAEMPGDVSWTEPDGGFFVWLEAPGVDADDLLEPAAETGVTFLPGSLFYPGTGGTDRMRLSYSFVSEDELAAGVGTLAESIRRARDESGGS